MSISGAMNTAVSGMLAQSTRLSAAASNLANIDTPGYQRLNASTTSMASGVAATVTQSADNSNVDMASEMLDLIGAKIEFQANAKMFETGADMWEMLSLIKRD
ncbi:MAG: flagellar basal body protein [Allorhizobium sp.]